MTLTEDSPAGTGAALLSDPGSAPLGREASEYYFAGGEIASSPKPIHLDGDPMPGIVFGTSNGRIYVLRADGTVAPGWPVTAGSLVGYSSAAVADLDGDGSQDVVFHSNNSVEAFSQAGTPLPGWPQALDGGVSGNSIVGSPVVADIDHDGSLEVLAGHVQRLYAFRSNGALVPGWPVLQSVGFGPLFSTPAAGDLDGDGDLEICFKIYGGNGLPANIHLFHHNGTPVPGWPKLNLDRSHLSSPAFADIDGDGRRDIIVSLHYNSGGNYVRLYVWKIDGSNVAGFPVTGSWNTSPSNNAVGDVDGDGRPEIFVATNNYTSPYYAVHAWNHDGTVLAGSWPRSAPYCLPDGSPALADINGGGNEVMVGVGGCYTNDPGSMNAWSGTGAPITGWPRAVAAFLRSSALVMDANGDGVPEIYIGSSDGWMHRFLTDQAGGSSPEWNQIFHDAGNTNCYGTAGTTAADEPAVRSRFRLLAPQPNPFTRETAIRYETPAGGEEMRISVFDAGGHRLIDLVRGPQTAGHHTVVWRGTDAANRRAGAGTYFVRLESGSSRETRKVVLGSER